MLYFHIGTEENLQTLFLVFYVVFYYWLRSLYLVYLLCYFIPANPPFVNPFSFINVISFFGVSFYLNSLSVKEGRTLHTRYSMPLLDPLIWNLGALQDQFKI